MKLKMEFSEKNLLSVFLNDKITYSFNDILATEDRLENVSDSLEKNKDFILRSLLESEDFPTFNLVLHYLEKNVVFITETYSDEISQINDQIKCSILEYVLNKMMFIRRKAISSDEQGNRVDNIQEFFNSKKLKKQMQVNPDAKFSLNFQTRLQKTSKDYLIRYQRK